MNLIAYIKWLFRRFPKWFLVVTVLTVSTVLFVFWWFNHVRVPVVQNFSQQRGLIESKSERLLLVDNDLYDVDSGKVIFQKWLKEGMPEKIFHDQANKKFIAQYERGFIRYTDTGIEEARLIMPAKLALSGDYKWMVFIKERDIWRADIDWKQLKLANEKKVTAIDQMAPMFFAENIIIGTEKTLIVRNLGKLLRINLDTGNVKPMRMQIDGLNRRRSPDCKFLVGVEDGQFYCYDVDADASKTIDIGRGVVNNFRWLGNDRCIALAAGKTVVIYDRSRNTLTEVLRLPSLCQQVDELSPGEKFIFALGRSGALLLDLEAKTASPVSGGAGVRWVSPDTFAYSRELPDSDMRGTWLQTVGQKERRVSPIPYLVVGNEAKILFLPETDLIIYSATPGLYKMRRDGSEFSELAKLLRPANAVTATRPWESDRINAGERPHAETTADPRR